MEKIKRKIRELINLVFYFTGFYFIFKFINKKKIRILMYHGIGSPQSNFEYPWLLVSKENFERQIKYLKKNYNIIPMYSLVDHIKNKVPFPPNSVVITLDDGLKNNYTYAFPILHKYNVSATIFLTTHYINTLKISYSNKLWYFIRTIGLEKLIEEFNIYFPLYSGLIGRIDLKNIIELIEDIEFILKFKTNDNEKEMFIQSLYDKYKIKIGEEELENIYLSWKEVKIMNDSGLLFGSHTSTHPVLTRLNYKDAEEEIIKSKIIMESQLNKRTDLFSYPFGHFNKEIKKILDDNNFSCAASSIEGLNKLDSDLFELKRICIFDEPFYCFKMRIVGFGALFEKVYQKLYGNFKRIRNLK